MFRRKIKFVQVLSHDGESIISVPKKGIYDPLTEIMDEEQIPEFLKKFQDYGRSLGLERAIKESIVLKLINKLNDNNIDFLKELNHCTDCFGRIDWKKFLS